MGCWNGTCGITNLPILGGDEIVVFLIAFDGGLEPSGFCTMDASAAAHRVSLPLFGKYNDYGGVKDLEDDPIVFNIVREQFNLENIPVQDWLNNIERNGCTLKYEMYPDSVHTRTIDLRIGLWMIHRRVFDSFINTPIDQYSRETLTPYEILIADAQLYLENVEKTLEEFKESGVDITKKSILSTVFTGCGNSNSERKFNCFSTLLYYSSGSVITEQFKKPYTKLFQKAFLDNDTDTLEHLTNLFIRTSLMEQNMVGLRTGYNAQLGKGSQSTCWKYYLNLMDAMKEYIDEKVQLEKEYEDYYG